MDFWNEDLRKAVHALIPEVEGKPVVNIGGYDGGVYVCRRIGGLHTDEDSFNGECEWVDPETARPDELTDGMSISCDCVRLGPGWWQDTYFGWLFVHAPELVSRSLAGDHSWAPSFLESIPPVSSPAPDLRRLAHRLLPRAGEPYLKTGEVVTRLRDKFGFFAAHPRVDERDVAGVAIQDCPFSVVVADDGETTDHLSFDVRSGEGILIGYRDEQHRIAVSLLVERCALLLDYAAIPQ